MSNSPPSSHIHNLFPKFSVLVLKVHCPWDISYKYEKENYRTKGLNIHGMQSTS